MAFHTTVTFYFVFFAATLFTLITPFTKFWTFDLLGLTTTTTNTNLTDLDLNIVRLGRGRFGFAGFVDIKEDIYDDCIVRITVQRSLKKEGPFSILPFIVDNVTLTVAMDRYYKPLVMPTADRCCDNAPSFRGKFVPPLKKSYIIINTCELSTDQLPSILMEGYYIIHITLYQNTDRVDVVIRTYVESK